MRKAKITILKVIASAVLQFIFPGFGYLANQKLILAVINALGFFVFFQIIARSGALETPDGLWTSFAMLLGIHLVTVIHSAYLATQPSEDRKLRAWLRYSFFAAGSLVLSSLFIQFRGVVFGYETHFMPSKSMVPTIRVDDYIFVDTTAYDKAEPKRGEIVTFVLPNASKTQYVKRIVGLPGDTIQFGAEGIWIGNVKPTESYVLPENDTGDALKVIFMGHAPRVVVPENAFFVLGDNRDSSNDSRFFGFVPKENITGKAIHIWLSKDGNGAFTFDRNRIFETPDYENLNSSN